jgi:hypothetical protein
MLNSAMKLIVRAIRDGSPPEEIVLGEGPTVGDLRAAICAAHGCEPRQVRVIIAKTVIKEDSALLSKFSISDENIRFHISGGPSATAPQPAPEPPAASVEVPSPVVAERTPEPTPAADNVKPLTDPSLPGYARSLARANPHHMKTLLEMGFTSERKVRNALLTSGGRPDDAAIWLTSGFFDQEYHNELAEKYYLGGNRSPEVHSELNALATPFMRRPGSSETPDTDYYRQLFGRFTDPVTSRSLPVLLTGEGELTAKQRAQLERLGASLSPVQRRELEEMVTEIREAIAVPPEKFKNTFALFVFGKNTLALKVLGKTLCRAFCEAPTSDVKAWLLTWIHSREETDLGLSSALTGGGSPRGSGRSRGSPRGSHLNRLWSSVFAAVGQSLTGGRDQWGLQ